MKKRTLNGRFFLFLLTTLLCLCTPAHARETLGYEVDSEGNACITYVPEAWTEVDIPEQIDGYRVTALADGLFEGGAVVRVSLPESVTKIPERCFADCTRLREVVLSSRTEEIGQKAFWNCRALRTVRLPKYLRRIGAFAFAHMSAERIELPEGLVELGKGAFSGCDELEEIVLRDRLRVIDEEAFSDCNARIRAEYGSAAEAFLKTRGIPYEYAFRETNGWVYTHGEQGASLLGRRTAISCADIPFTLHGAQVSAVGAGAFQTDSELTEVRLSDGVRGIGDWAFSYCPSLKTVVLNEGLEEIGKDAFRECPALERVEIPRSVTIIGERAFADCSGLILCVYGGSEAERYALEQGIPFEVIGE